LYYSQPMLGVLAPDIHAAERAVGFVPTLTQLGYALGILLLAPLGDRFDRRRIILAKAAVLAAALLASAAAPGIGALLAASLALRLVAAFLPILSLYLAKLILDGIVAEHARPAAEAGLADWLADPARARLAILVAAELGLALLSDLTGRLASLTETLIGDLYA
ncbi:hypothetical protein QUR35_24880, partial [Salmonella enterica]